MIPRLVFGLGVFAGSLAVGYALSRARLLSESRAIRLLHWVVRWSSPLVLCVSFWSLRLTQRQLVLLPVIGALVMCAAMGPAWLYGRRAGLSRPEQGSFITCAMFSNLGFIGAFIAFAFAGEMGYSFAMLYVVLFSPTFYLIGFTVAKRFGAPSQAGGHAGLLDDVRAYPIIGMVVGLGLSLAHVPRPAALETINSVAIPANTALYLIAIGAQLHVDWSGRWLGPCLAMSAIKFLYTPAIGWICVQLFGLQGLPRFIVLLQCAMPVALSPLMLPAFYGVDRRLANIVWLWTTLLSVPVLAVYVPLIQYGQ